MAVLVVVLLQLLALLALLALLVPPLASWELGAQPVR